MFFFHSVLTVSKDISVYLLISLDVYILGQGDSFSSTLLLRKLQQFFVLGTSYVQQQQTSSQCIYLPKGIFKIVHARVLSRILTCTITRLNIFY